MKCPYCDQDHPADIDICPNTGKPLGRSALGESAQEGQPVTQPGIEMAFQAEPPPAIQEQPAPESPAARTAQVMENTPDQVTPAAPLESQTNSSEAPEPGLVIPEQAALVPPGGAITTRRRQALAWMLGGCLGVPLVILLVLAALVFLDPFKLHVVGRINGSFDAAAEVMPADTGMYLGINIANALITHVDRSVGPFLPAQQPEQTSTSLGFLSAPADPKFSGETSPIDSLLQQISTETGVRVPEDISPWVGQYAGIGVTDFEGDEYGAPFPTGWIIAIEARNLSRADQFLNTLEVNLTDLQHLDFDRQAYKSVNIYTQKPSGSAYAISFGRMGRMVILASNLATLKEIIDRQAGQSLPSDKDYLGLVGLRPYDWSASLYLNHSLIGSLVDQVLQSSMPQGAPVISTFTNLDWSGILLSASSIKQGLRFDTFTDLATASDPSAISQMEEIPSRQLLQMLPQETLAYVISSSFDQAIQGMLTSAMTDISTRDDFFQGFEQTFGFSLEKDLISKLNGPWSLSVVPSSRGLIATQANLNLAVNLTVQTEGDLDLKSITQKLNSQAFFTGFTISEQAQSGVTLYEISSYGEDNPMLAFGAGNGYFTLGTDVEVLKVSPPEDGSLISSTSYLGALKALPSGMQPYVYIDFTNLFANIREGLDSSKRESFNNSIRSWEPLGVVALSSRILQPDVIHTSIVVLLADQ